MVQRFFLMIIGAVLVAVLAACGGASQPTTTTPPSTTSTTSAPSTANVQGDYVALLHDGHTRVALSTDGQQMVAYACDGDDSHPPTFAPWFSGSVNNNSVDLNSTTGGDTLQATLSPQNATGTLTLENGNTDIFTADLLSSTDIDAGSGLYRSQATLSGVPYLAGWIAEASTSGGTSSTTPTAMIVPPPAMIIGERHTGGVPLAALYPAGPIRRISLEAAILNQQTQELLAPPELTSSDIAAKQVEAANLGTFPLTYCHLGTCS